MLVAVITLTPMTTRADCIDDIKVCDKAVQTQKKALSECSKTLNLGLQQRDVFATTLTEREKELQAWYRNPFVMLGLGIISGIVIVK